MEMTAVGAGPGALSRLSLTDTGKQGISTLRLTSNRRHYDDATVCTSGLVVAIDLGLSG